MASILSVADTYDALVSDRPYRRGLDGDKAFQIIQSESGRQFNPQVVDAFRQAINDLGYEQIQRSTSELNFTSPLDHFMFSVHGKHEFLAEKIRGKNEAKYQKMDN
jgi:hypothetical protein